MAQTALSDTALRLNRDLALASLDLSGLTSNDASALTEIARFAARQIIDRLDHVRDVARKAEPGTAWHAENAHEARRMAELLRQARAVTAAAHKQALVAGRREARAYWGPAQVAA